MNIDIPNWENDYLAKHVELLLQSYCKLTGKELINFQGNLRDKAEKIFNSTFAVVSHNTQDDPVFNYRNETALDLFELSWDDFTKLHSRKSAEPVNRKERARLLKRVTESGFIDDYCGIRISSTGKRFEVKSATVWNVIDEKGVYRGQAATFDNWSFL